MKSSHSLDRWLLSRQPELAAAGVTALAGRGPVMSGQSSATWISFGTARSTGRVVLWSTGRCQLDALSHDGSRLCAEELQVVTAGELDDALTHLTGCLAGAPRR